MKVGYDKHELVRGKVPVGIEVFCTQRAGKERLHAINERSKLFTLGVSNQSESKIRHLFASHAPPRARPLAKPTTPDHPAVNPSLQCLNGEPLRCSQCSWQTSPAVTHRRHRPRTAGSSGPASWVPRRRYPPAPIGRPCSPTGRAKR